MKKTLLAVALLGASSAAMADAWIYGGASVGQTDYKDYEGTSYSIHAGSGLLPFIGIEGGLTQHSDFNDNGLDFQMTSYYLAIKPSIDFGPLHIYAKGGYHMWDKDAEGRGDDDVFDLYNGYNEDFGFDKMYGVGIEYHVIWPVSVGASVMNYTVGEDDMLIYSLNASVHIF